MKPAQRKRAPKPLPATVPVPRDRAWVRHGGAMLGLWALALAAYSNSFSGSPAGDAALLLHDPRIAAVNIRTVTALFHQQYWTSGTSGLYRPLATLSYLFNYAILGSGLNADGYHALNFLLHAVNMLLVYVLGLLVLRSFTSAVLMAAIWGLHPVLTESVTNIAGRPDLLAGFGVLAGLVAHIIERRAPGRARIAWMAVLAVCFTVGLFSKENAVVLIGLMAAYDLAWKPPAWRRALGSYAAALLPLAIFLYLRAHALAGAPPMYTLFTDNPLTGTGFWTARLTAAGVIARYLGLLAWPARLASDYSFHAIPLFGWHMNRAGDWAALAGLAGCAAAGIAAVTFYTRCREVSFFLAFFAIALAPTANVLLIIGTIMAERFLYLPAVAFAACLVLGGTHLADRIGPRRRVVVPAAAAVLCCALGARTYARNADWRDERSLWESTVIAVPENAKAHITLADILMDPNGRDLRRAVEEADRAIAIVNGLPDARNIAADYAVAGRAYRLMGESMPVGGGRAEWFQKALATLTRGESIDAAASETLRRSPAGRFYATLGEPEIYSELGKLYSRMGRPANAVEALEKAGRLRPGAPDDGDSAALAGAYYAMGQWRKAAVALLEGEVLNPGNPALRSQLLALYRERDPAGCEWQGSPSSPQLNLACSTVREDLCAALSNVVRLRRARGEPRLAEMTAQSARGEFGCATEK